MMLKVFIFLIFQFHLVAEDRTNPRFFFSKKNSPVEFPEHTWINEDKLPFTLVYRDYLMRAGVTITNQYSPTYSSNFDLYFPTINWPRYKKKSFEIFPGYEVGSYYLTRHDAYHHFAGIPGVRLKDIAPSVLEETKEKIVRILLVF